MAWIYSRELADCHSRWVSGLDQSLIANLMFTANQYFCPQCSVVISHTHRFGTTCEHFGVSILMFQSKLFTGDSPAKIEVLRALARAWLESVPRFSGKLSGSRKQSDPNSFLSKTRAEQKKTFPKCYRPLMRLGTKQERARWRRRKLVPITEGTDCLFWPTPTASNYGSNRGGAAGRVGKIRRSISGLVGGPVNPAFLEWLMGYCPGWTAVDPLVMQWYRSKRGKRSKD